MAFLDTLKLWALGFFKIPMIFYVSPSVVELDDHRCVIKIPLSRRTQNHWGTMYFGALSVGADCAGGTLAWKLAKDKYKGKVSIIFKDFYAEFFKRPEGHTYFTFEDGDKILQAMETAIQSGERQNIPVTIIATIPSKETDPVAKFRLTLSLKIK